MIKHITLWKLKDFACGNDKETNYELSKEESRKNLKEFPKLLSVEVGRGYKVGGANFDMVKILTFACKEDLEEYLASPCHKATHEFSKEIRTDRAVIDYVVEEL